MLNVNDILQPFFTTIFIFIGIAFVVAVLIILLSPRGRELRLTYSRKKYLFDVKTELELFRILNELYEDRYYVFPQVHYSHLLQPSRDLSYRDRFTLRNKIDRKSADFVLCDKGDVTVKLVIELDGSSHDLPERQHRDEFINTIMRESNLPLLHISTTRMDKESVRQEVDTKLSEYQTDSLKSRYMGSSTQYEV